MNDPVAVLLVLGFIEWIEHPGFGAVDMAWLFAQDLAIGLAVGARGRVCRRRPLRCAAAWRAAASIRWRRWQSPPSRSGGRTLGRLRASSPSISPDWCWARQIPARRTIAAFHEGLSWVAQVAMFFTLGLLVFPATRQRRVRGHDPGDRRGRDRATARGFRRDRVQRYTTASA